MLTNNVASVNYYETTFTVRLQLQAGEKVAREIDFVRKIFACRRRRFQSINL